MSSKAPHIHPNTVRAALGSATLLHGFLLPKAPPEAPQMTQNTPETAPEQPSMEETTQKGLKDLETKFMGELTEIKEIMKPKDKNKEIEDLKKQIMEVLNSDDNETN